jgi:hypothetical protein
MFRGPLERTMIPGKAFEVTHTEEEWRRILTPEQYRIMRAHGTEVPGSCALNHEKRPGAFVCAGCGQRLFASSKKFNSGTGWPSFNDPIEGALIPPRTKATAWRGPRCVVADAVAIWAMSFQTGRRQRICAIVSTALPWIFCRTETAG